MVGVTSLTSSAPRSRRRILLVSSLVVGTVASVALMTAGQWVPFLDWAALAVALVAGFLATWAALVEFREWRFAALADAASARAAERERTQQLHETQRRVLTTVDARIHAIAGALGETRTELDATKQELVTTKVTLGESQQLVSRLRGDNESLRAENGDLRQQLVKATEPAVDADVLALPRRRATETVAQSEWSLVDAPTVIDLDLQRLAQPFVADVQARHAN